MCSNKKTAINISSCDLCSPHHHPSYHYIFRNQKNKSSLTKRNCSCVKFPPVTHWTLRCVLNYARDADDVADILTHKNTKLFLQQRSGSCNTSCGTICISFRIRIKIWNSSEEGLRRGLVGSIVRYMLLIVKQTT